MGSAQSNKIDSLIKQLNNSEIKPDGNFFGPTFYLRQGPGKELFKIGKPATDKLLSVLEDSTKGVVAHYILTWLWHDSIPDNPPIYIEKDKVTVFKFNNLTFFIKGVDVYANSFDLRSNAMLWKVFLQDKNRR